MAQALVSVIDNGKMIALPTPAEYSGLTSTIVDSGRNVKGKMVGSVIRSDVASIDMSWRYLTIEQWAKVLKLFNSKDNFIRKVCFFNQTTGKYLKISEARDMYISDRSAKIFRRNQKGDVVGWVDCSLSLVEV